MPKSVELNKKTRKAPPPIIVPKQISDWIRETSTIGRVNTWTVGSGRALYTNK